MNRFVTLSDTYYSDADDVELVVNAKYKLCR